MTTAEAVAKQLVRLADADAGDDLLTPLRLQKLLYYCQGWHLAWYGGTLFPDPIEAWAHGPVVPAVQQLAWINGRDPIPDQGEPAGLSERDRDAVAQVWREYRQHSACKLRDLSHREAPWKAAYQVGERRPIGLAALGAFFSAEYERLTGMTTEREAEADRNIAAGNTIPFEELGREWGV